MNNNEQACDAQPQREAIANQFSQAQQAATTVSVANYPINTAAIGIFGSKAAISHKDVYLRPSLGQSPCKFLEITRDSVLYNAADHPARLSTNFQCNHPRLSVSNEVQRDDALTANSVANYLINTAAIGIFGRKTAFGSSSEAALNTKAAETLQSSVNQQSERSGGGELSTGFTSRSAHASRLAKTLQSELTTNSVANYSIKTAAIGTFSYRTAFKSNSEATLTSKTPRTIQTSANSQHERSGSAERSTGYTSRSAQAGERTKTLQAELTTDSIANYVINTAAIGIFGSKKAASRQSEPLKQAVVLQPCQQRSTKALSRRSTKPVFTLDNNGFRAPTPALMFRAQHETCGEAQTLVECGCLNAIRLRDFEESHSEEYHRRLRRQSRGAVLTLPVRKTKYYEIHSKLCNEYGGNRYISFSKSLNLSVQCSAEVMV